MFILFFYYNRYHLNENEIIIVFDDDVFTTKLTQLNTFINNVLYERSEFITLLMRFIGIYNENTDSILYMTATKVN